MSISRTVLAGLLLSLLMLGGAAASAKVDINTADAATLSRVLANVGAAKAEQIVAYRAANGPFKSVDELVLVQGIGLGTVEVNRDRIEVGAPSRGSAGAGGSSGQQR